MSGSRRTSRRIAAARADTSPYSAKKSTRPLSINTRARLYAPSLGSSSSSGQAVPEHDIDTDISLVEPGSESHHERICVSEEAPAADIEAGAASSSEASPASEHESLESYKAALAVALAEVKALKTKLSSVNEEKDIALSCNVCFTADSRPRVLLCGHVTCESCLVAMYRHAPLKFLLECPLCQKGISISSARPPILCYQLRDAWALGRGSAPSEAEEFIWPPPQAVASNSASSSDDDDPLLLPPRSPLRTYLDRPGRRGRRNVTFS
ncbi:uncharacterized protein SCHCODRAFT_02671581 [Schizophyllum commune H4-8]|nr:uncharacterized protein SCHCODRAFT_02671581 [Schizophyllum commune H4-8]KAI5887584.1 hypothetical protein SCHCODRAFT_02671581 [Schizophyllum commune H4-8]